MSKSELDLFALAREDMATTVEAGNDTRFVTAMATFYDVIHNSEDDRARVDAARALIDYGLTYGALEGLPG